MRQGSTYRAARRTHCRKVAKRDWRALPFAMLKLHHSNARIIVRAVPTLAEPPKDHPKF